MTLHQLARNFLDDRKLYCAAASIDYYDENLSRFLRWLSIHYDLDPEELQDVHLTKEAYRSYLLWLRQTHSSNVTVNTYIRAVRVFLRWLHLEEFLENDITVNVKYPRMDPEFVFPLTRKEAASVDACFNQDDYIGIRNYCIFHLMLDAGFRSGEVIDLKWQHVKDRFLFIENSKFNKSRSVPVPEWLHERLIHLQELSPVLSDFVFMGRYGTERITSNTVKMLFYDLKAATGIKRIHAHLLRHTFASSYIYYGGNMELLRVLLGHSSYDVTRNYLHIANQMLLSGYDMYQVDDLYFNLLGRR